MAETFICKGVPMRKGFFIAAISALALGLVMLFMPARTNALGGCNQICAGDFPGTCTYTYDDYICADANPPWTVCDFQPSDCGGGDGGGDDPPDIEG